MTNSVIMDSGIFKVIDMFEYFTVIISWMFRVSHLWPTGDLSNCFLCLFDMALEHFENFSDVQYNKIYSTQFVHCLPHD